MSGHTPWAQIKHKSAERKAAKVKKEEAAREWLKAALSVNLYEETVRRNYGLEFEKIQTPEYIAFIFWRELPGHEKSAYYRSENVYFRDHSHEEPLVRHERIGLFAYHTVDLGKHTVLDWKSMEEALKETFHSSLERAVEELTPAPAPDSLPPNW